MINFRSHSLLTVIPITDTVSFITLLVTSFVMGKGACILLRLVMQISFSKLLIQKEKGKLSDFDFRVLTFSPAIVI